MITFTCLSCGVEKKRTAHSGKGLYCSHQCQADHKSSKRKELFWLGKLEIIDRPTIRKYVAEVRGYNCVECNIGEWNGKPITLQVNHKDGNAANNHPDNVELICPNCHSQTETFGARNKGNGRKARGLSLR